MTFSNLKDKTGRHVIYPHNSFEWGKELPTNAFDIIITDPEIGWSIERNELWINTFLNALKVGCYLMITGHPYTNLFVVKQHPHAHFLCLEKTHPEQIINIKYLKPPVFDYDKPGYIHDGWALIDFCVSQSRYDWLESVREAVLRYTKEDDVICDPFLGKGTLAFIAKETNRKSVCGEYKLLQAKIIIDVLNEDVDTAERMLDIAYRRQTAMREMAAVQRKRRTLKEKHEP